MKDKQPDPRLAHVDTDAIISIVRICPTRKKQPTFEWTGPSGKSYILSTQMRAAGCEELRRRGVNVAAYTPPSPSANRKTKRVYAPRAQKVKA